MAKEIDKLLRARDILNMMIQGEDPINHVEIDDASFLNEPKMIRCFSYIVEVLSKEIEYQSKKRKKDREPFKITAEQLEKVQFPDGLIGVNMVAKAINELIDIRIMKKLTGAQINQKLREMGILDREVGDDGRKRTVTNDVSINYGIESIKNSFNGQEYEKVVFNEDGKKFIIDHLDDILNFEKQE